VKYWPLSSYHTVETYRVSGGKLHLRFYSDEWSIFHSTYFDSEERPPVLRLGGFRDPVWRKVLPLRDIVMYTH
jgi:hypothetical protein